VKSQFLGGAYQLRSLPLSAQTCVNLYPVQSQAPGGEVGAFYGTPGKKLLTNLGVTGQGRGLVTASHSGSTLVAVVGSGVYKVIEQTANGSSGSGPKSYVVTLLGNLPTVSGRVSMAANAASQVAICDSTGMYVANISTNSLTGPIANGPTAQSIVAYMDGYGIFIVPGFSLSGQFGITAIDDFTTISALNVATAEALPDDLVCAIVTQRELWLLGAQTTEIWSDTGAASFPWERIPGGVLHVGCSSFFLPALVDDNLFWVTTTPNGAYRVVKSVGYQVEYVSSYAVEESLQDYYSSLPGAEVQTPWGYGYQHEGHSFYVLNIPGAGLTWVYDIGAGLWHRRAYRDTNGALHQELGNAYAYWAGKHLYLDLYNGNLYQLDSKTYTDNGAAIYRERAWPLVGPEELHRIRVDKIELDAETGVGNETGTDTDPQVCLEMSFDGGRHFGYSRYQSMGTVGLTEVRPTWRRNGTGRRPVARLSTTAQTKIGWLGVNTDGEVLTR
jgi:hypothetical protein